MSVAASTERPMFEGTVRMVLPNLDGPAGEPTVFEVKGSRARWDVLPTVGVAAGYKIYDATARRMFTVFPAQKMLVVDDLGKGAGESAQKPGTGKWVFAPLGAGRVSDFPCERLRAGDGARTYELCATGAILPLPLEYALPDAALRAPFLADLEAGGRLLLAASAVAGSLDGGRVPLQSQLLRAVEIRRGPIDDARFDVPDYPVSGAGHASIPNRAVR
jgi:hypothetical protein